MEQTSSSTQCNYRWKNLSPSPNQQTSYLPVRLSSLTSPTSSTVSPVQCYSKSPKSSPSPPSSMNKQGPSTTTTNGLMAHGTPSSWRRASAKAAHSHPFLPCLLSQTFSSHLTSNYIKEPPPRLHNGDPGDDSFGGITHHFGYVDNVSACAPLVDLHFLCDRFATIGALLGCFVNPMKMKTRILTSTLSHPPNQSYSCHLDL